MKVIGKYFLGKFMKYKKLIDLTYFYEKKFDLSLNLDSNSSVIYQILSIYL